MSEIISIAALIACIFTIIYQSRIISRQGALIIEQGDIIRRYYVLTETRFKK